ncbi:MAG: COQ9 family protein [Candidatus Eiseniibacteriota bacterium]
MTKKLDAVRDTLLDATLAHVPFDGWTETAIEAGAKDAGVDRATAQRAFPSGALAMIEYFNARADRAMEAAMASQDPAPPRLRDRIALAVRLRLEANAPHREAIRRGLAYLALPQNAPVGAKCLYRTVDAIWYAAGDRATDFSFYTKRALLAGVYSATVLYWINDASEGFARTWAFLDRRIDEVLRVFGGIGRVTRGLERTLPDPFKLFRPTAGRRPRYR